MTECDCMCQEEVALDRVCTYSSWVRVGEERDVNNHLSVSSLQSRVRVGQ